MIVFTDLFFKTKYPSQTALQVHETRKLLDQLYKRDPQRSDKTDNKNVNSFNQQKNELLTLLTYYSFLYPKLSLFQSYRQNVKKLTETTAKIDIDITLKAAKNLLENMLGTVGQKQCTVDNAKFNSYEVSACYQGAYSNLAQALSLFQGNALSVAVVDTKQSLIYGIAADFIRDAKDPYLIGHEIHRANTLASAVAEHYGIPHPVDHFANRYVAVEIERFKLFLNSHLRPQDFIEFIVHKAPELPKNVLDADDGRRFRQEQKKIENFFEWLGDKTVSDHDLRKLYQIEQTADFEFGSEREAILPQPDKLVYRLIPQKKLGLFRRCLVAEYLERQGYLKGVYLSIGDYTLVTDGEALVCVDAEKGYRLLSQDDMLKLLHEKRLKNEPLLVKSLLNQLSPESLRRVFDNEISLVINQQREWSFDALLRRHDLSPGITNAICKSLLNQTSEQVLKKQFLDYVFHSSHEIFPDGLSKLTAQMKVTTEQAFEYFIDAIERDSVMVVRFLCETFRLLHCWPNEMVPPIHLVANKNALKVMVYFAHKGVDLNASRSDGKTALLLMAERGWAEALTKLVELGANVNKPTPEGNTPALAAALNGNAICLQTLKAFGADLNAKTKRGNTIAHRAVKGHNKDILNELISWGIPIDEKNEQGITPIMIAASQGNNVCCVMLENAGAKVDRVDNTGEGLVHKAALSGSSGMIELMAVFGLDLNKKNHAGWTAARIATANCHLITLKSLETLGANLDECSSSVKGETLGFLAAEKGYISIVHHLMSKASFHLPVEKTAKEWMDYISKCPQDVKKRMTQKIRERLNQGDREDAIHFRPYDIAEIHGHRPLAKQIDRFGFSQIQPSFSSLFKTILHKEPTGMERVQNGMKI